MNLAKSRVLCEPRHHLSKLAMTETTCSIVTNENRVSHTLSTFCFTFMDVRIVPSYSSADIPFLFCFFGVFINRGKIVLRPRMSTNLAQFSFPSSPVNAWFNTFNAPFLDIFFSLQEDHRHRDKGKKGEGSCVKFIRFNWQARMHAYRNIKFINCRPSPFKNLSRFGVWIRLEQIASNMFSIISCSSPVLGSCRLNTCHFWKEQNHGYWRPPTKGESYSIVIINFILLAVARGYQCHQFRRAVDGFLAFLAVRWTRFRCSRAY